MVDLFAVSLGLSLVLGLFFGVMIRSDWFCVVVMTYDYWDAGFEWLDDAFDMVRWTC